MEVFKMDPRTLLIVIVFLLAVGAGLWFYFQRRSQKLRSMFGSEYDRTVREIGDRHKAESILIKRKKHVEELDIRPLAAAAVERFNREWQSCQAKFVDDPRGAVREADHLVAEVMKTRGYPVGDFEQRAADVSVDHPGVVENYRGAHEIAVREERGKASTEDLRRALVYYKTLFEELLGIGEPVLRR
jgi:hypothetical protein